LESKHSGYVGKRYTGSTYYIGDLRYTSHPTNVHKTFLRSSISNDIDSKNVVIAYCRKDLKQQLHQQVTRLTSNQALNVKQPYTFFNRHISSLQAFMAAHSANKQFFIPATAPLRLRS
jgi:hypothetical protein